MPNDWLSEIAAGMTIEDLPGDYQDVARAIGVEHALKLSEYVGGMRLYFPQIDGLLRNARDKRICLEFNGCNHRELARKYALTETWIREIVQRKPADETADMFEVTSGLSK